MPVLLYNIGSAFHTASLLLHFPLPHFQSSRMVIAQAPAAAKGASIHSSLCRSWAVNRICMASVWRFCDWN